MSSLPSFRIGSEGTAVPVSGGARTPHVRTERVALSRREFEQELLAQEIQSLGGRGGGGGQTCLAMLPLALACLDENILVTSPS